MPKKDSGRDRLDFPRPRKKCGPIYPLLVFLLLFHGCTAQLKETAQLSNTALVATTGPIPIALEHKLSEQDIARLKRHYPMTLRRLKDYHPLTPQDIINMTRAGITDKVIIHEIQVTRSQFYLTPEDEQRLVQGGVSKRVIETMLTQS